MPENTLAWVERTITANHSPASPVLSSATLVDDLGFDSLDCVEFVLEIEDAFDVSVPDEEAERVVTVADAVALIDRLVQEQHPHAS